MTPAEPRSVRWFSHRDLRHPRAGGAERATFEIARRLVRRGWTVRWTATRSPGLPRRESVDGIDIERPGGPVTTHLAVPAIAAGDPAASVVVEDLGHVVPWGTAYQSRRPGTAFFHHLHRRTLAGQLPEVPAAFLARLERGYRTWLGDRSIVATTPSSRDDLVAIGIAPERISVIPLGVDTDAFRPGDRASPPLLVYFGGMRPYKRPDHAIRTIAAVRRAGIDARLAVVGTGPLAPGLVRLAADLGVGPYVDFAGRLEDAGLRQLLARASINLHTSIAEGWCLSALEAASAGIPTVAYRVPGLETVVEEGRSGSLVPDSGPEALATRTIDLLTDGSLPEWGPRCREVASRFPWDATADAWDRHLRSVIEGRPARGAGGRRG
ncbi:MAG TPA: glycosyltransferase family 4 protein [Thermoplasmata archaeon]|nr:glycosyltransferase family 4 protein [Thermoplasmata archaeon]